MVDTRICPQCGNKENAYTFFCTQCGAKTVEGEAAIKAPVTEPITDRNTSTNGDEENFNNTYSESENDSYTITRGVKVNNTGTKFGDVDKFSVREELSNKRSIVAAADKGFKNKIYIVGGIAACILVIFIIFAAMPRGGRDENIVERTQDARNEVMQENEESDEDWSVGNSHIDENDQQIIEDDAINSIDVSLGDESIDDIEAVEYVLPHSDSQYLTKADLAGLTAKECRIARNELFARHGRLFADEELQAYFNSCSWYVGRVRPDDFNDSVFNNYEVANRDLIVQFEAEQGYQ